MSPIIICERLYRLVLISSHPNFAMTGEHKKKCAAPSYDSSDGSKTSKISRKAKTTLKKVKTNVSNTFKSLSGSRTRKRAGQASGMLINA